MSRNISTVSVAACANKILSLNTQISKEIRGLLLEHTLVGKPFSAEMVPQDTLDKMRQVDALLLVIGEHPRYSQVINSNINRKTL